MPVACFVRPSPGPWWMVWGRGLARRPLLLVWSHRRYESAKEVNMFPVILWRCFYFIPCWIWIKNTLIKIHFVTQIEDECKMSKTSLTMSGRDSGQVCRSHEKTNQDFSHEHCGHHWSFDFLKIYWYVNMVHPPRSWSPPQQRVGGHCHFGGEL